MTSPSRFPGGLAAIAAAMLCSSGAGAAAEKPSGPNDSAAIFPGTSSKEPISIDADKLVYYDKEHKAVYSGNVVVIQGDTKMTCSAMTVFLDHAPTTGAASQPKEAAPQATNGQSGPAADSGVKHLDAAGPVTVISKTQVATGDSGSYDKAEDKVRLIGHVTLSDGQNVTKGDKLTYDLKNGLATVDTSAKSGRVHGQFVPKSSADAAKPGADATKADAAKPK
jgi:lipopolysaccharide export system protein LptA